jgi:hypothetical protein
MILILDLIFDQFAQKMRSSCKVLFHQMVWSAFEKLRGLVFSRETPWFGLH